MEGNRVGEGRERRAGQREGREGEGRRGRRRAGWKDFYCLGELKILATALNSDEFNILSTA